MVLQFFEREDVNLRKKVDVAWGLEAESLQEQKSAVTDKVNRILPTAMLPRLLLFAEHFRAHAYQQALVERLTTPGAITTLAIHPAWSSPSLLDSTVREAVTFSIAILLIRVSVKHSCNPVSHGDGSSATV